jgi:hypothetical protein
MNVNISSYIFLEVCQFGDEYYRDYTVVCVYF